MAINPGANGPLLKLIELLQKLIRKAKRNALLVIPLGIINDLLHSSLRADSTSVASLVNLFDGYNKGNCSRLDAVSFHCVLHVFLTAQQCPARGRGLHLFLESLRDLTNALQNAQDKSILAAFHKRKSVLAQKTLRSVFHTFSSDDVTLPRRWSGEFIFELIRDSADNQKLLSDSLSDSLRHIGSTVLSGKDYCLQFIAGAIVRGMVDSGYNASGFWPADANQPTIAQFPTTKLSDPDWVRSFTDFARRLYSLWNPELPERVKLIQSTEIQGQASVSMSGCSACMVISDPVTFVSMRDKRPHFIDVPVRSIGNIKTLRSSIHLQLRHDGYYIAHGLSRWSSRVSIGFSDATQAADVGGIIEDTINSPLQGRPKHVTFASDSYSPHITPKSGQNKTYKMSEGPVALGTAGAERTVVERPQTSPNRPRRTPSYASLELPSAEQVASQSKKLVQKAEYLAAAIPDSLPTSAAMQVRRTPSPGAGAGMQDSSRIELLNQQIVGSGPQVVPDSWSDDLEVVPLPNAGCGGGRTDAFQKGQEDDKDVHSGFPLLARQSLQPQPRTSTVLSLTTTETAKPKDSGPDKKSISLVQPGISRQNTNYGLVEPAIDADTNKGHTRSQANDIVMHEQQDGQHARARAPANNSRLKRPNRKARRPKSRKRSVDWYQDLRVEDAEHHAATKKAKCNAAKTAPEQISMFQKNKATSPAKLLPAHQLPLATDPRPKEINKAPEETRARRAKRQVTRTLASARSSRKAAVRANEKLVDTCHESDNVAFDPDDPIESSSLVSLDGQEAPEDQGILQQEASGGYKGLNAAVAGDFPTEAPTVNQKSSTTPVDALGESRRYEGNDLNDVEPAVAEQGNRDTVGTRVPVENQRTIADDKKSNAAIPADDETSVPNIGSPTKESASGTAKKFNSLFISTATTNQKREGPAFKSQGNERNALGNAKPQVSSEISRRVSQFISRQVASNIQHCEDRIEKTEMLDDDAEGGITALHSSREAHPMSPGAEEDEPEAEAVDPDEDVADEVYGNTNRRASECPTQDTRMDITVISSSAQQEITRDPNDEDPGEESDLSPHIIVNDTNLGDNSSPLTYIASEADMNSDDDLSDASTLVPRFKADDTHAKANGSTPMGEPLTHQFLSSNFLGQYSSSRASSVDDSPCPKGRGPRELMITLVKEGPGDDTGTEYPKTPMARVEGSTSPKPRGVQNRKRKFPTSDTDECMSPKGNGQTADADGIYHESANCNANWQPTKRAGARILGKHTISYSVAKAATATPARPTEGNTIVDRLKACVNGTNERGMASGRSGVWQASESSAVTVGPVHAGTEEEESDPISKPNTEETRAGSQNTTYSSYLASEESTGPGEYEPRNAEGKWQKALRDSQRNALDILLDTSHRLIRNLVDEEKAISSVVDVYKRGCSRIFEQMTQAHDENLVYMDEIQQRAQEGLIGHCKVALQRVELTDEARTDQNTAIEMKKAAVETERRSRKVLRQIENVMQECHIDERAQEEN